MDAVERPHIADDGVTPLVRGIGMPRIRYVHIYRSCVPLYLFQRGKRRFASPYVLYHAQPVLSADSKVFFFLCRFFFRPVSRPSADFRYQPELQFKAALTSGAAAAIVDNNQVRIAKVMGLYAIATHDVC